MTGLSSEKTPLPFFPPIATASAHPDPEDPRGWTYCYYGDYSQGIVDPAWYSQFSGDIIGSLSNLSICHGVAYGLSPARAVSQAYFLFETTTASANAPSAPSLRKLQSSVDEQAVSSAPVDPFASEHIMYTSDPTDSSNSPQSKQQSTLPMTEFPETSHAGGEHEGLNTDLDAARGDQFLQHAPLSASATSSKESFPARPLSALHRSSVKSSASNALASLVSGAAARSTSVTGTGVVTGFPALGNTKTHSLYAVHQSGTPLLGDMNVAVSSATIPQPPGTAQAIEGISGAQYTATGKTLAEASFKALLSTHHSTSGLPSVLTLGLATATLIHTSEYLVGEETLKPGDPAISVSGIGISMASDAAAVAVGSTTSRTLTPLSVADIAWTGTEGTMSTSKTSPMSTFSLRGDNPEESPLASLTKSDHDKISHQGDTKRGGATLPISTPTLPQATPSQSHSGPTTSSLDSVSAFASGSTSSSMENSSDKGLKGSIKQLLVLACAIRVIALLLL